MPKFILLNHVIDASFLNIEMIWIGMRNPMLKEMLGESIPDSFCEVLQGNTLKYYQNQGQATRFAKICAKAIISDNQLLLEIKEKTKYLAKQIIDLGENQYNFSKISEEEMLILLKKIQKLQSNISSWGMPIAFADINGNISNRITKIIAKRKELKYTLSVYLENLSNPSESSLTDKAYQEILNSNNNEYLLKKYFWLDQGYVSLGLTKEQLKTIKEEQKKKEKPNLINKNELLAELKLSPEEQRIFKVSAEMVYLKTLRGDSRQVLHVLTNHIVKEMAKRNKLERQNLHMLSSFELINYLNKKDKLPNNLKQRHNHSIFEPINQLEYRIISQVSEIKKFLSKKIETDNSADKDKSSLVGQIAQPGHVKARACLVLDASENYKIKEGDILISISTSPQLLPAMKKASAFITEMGGITSHAAIVSRELKKPCLVGVKSITSIVKDGDLVEVDANRGVAKIINKIKD